MSENNFSKSHTPNAKIGRKCHRSTKQAHRTQKANLSQLVEFKIRELESRTAAADALLERTGAGHKSDSAVDPLTILQQTYSEGGANGLADLMQKYSQALHASEKELLQARRRFEGHIREKDHTSSECSRVAQIRVKLESLSRELQKHNKLLIDDAKTRSTEHACRREEVSEKLRESITDITNKVEKQAEENQRMSDENDKLAEKLMELKMKFREKIESYQEQLTQRMESVQNLHNEVPLQQKKTESTAQTISLLNNKIQQYNIATLKMSEHIDLLKGKLSEFTDAREKTQEYSQTACAQKKNLNSKVEDIQSEKNMYVTKKEEHWKVREANGHELKELKQRIAMAEKMRRQKDLEFRKLNKKETPSENIS